MEWVLLFDLPDPVDRSQRLSLEDKTRCQDDLPSELDQSCKELRRTKLHREGVPEDFNWAGAWLTQGLSNPHLAYSGIFELDPAFRTSINGLYCTIAAHCYLKDEVWHRTQFLSGLIAYVQKDSREHNLRHDCQGETRSNHLETTSGARFPLNLVG